MPCLSLFGGIKKKQNKTKQNKTKLLRNKTVLTLFPDQNCELRVIKAECNQRKKGEKTISKLATEHIF